MNRERFESEMRRAQAMARLESDPLRADWWNGYMRGLRRGFHGENFGTSEEHTLWLALAVESEDEARHNRGLGYREGLAFINRSEIAAVLGRRGGKSSSPAKLAGLRRAQQAKRVPDKMRKKILSSDQSGAELSRELGLSQSVISRIRKGTR